MIPMLRLNVSRKTFKLWRTFVDLFPWTQPKLVSCLTFVLMFVLPASKHVDVYTAVPARFTLTKKPRSQRTRALFLSLS